MLQKANLRCHNYVPLLREEPSNGFFFLRVSVNENDLLFFKKRKKNQKILAKEGIMTYLWNL